MHESFRYSALWLVGFIAVVFALQAFIPGFTGLFVLDSARVWTEPYRLLTAVFLHGGFTHLLLNSFALFLFGLLLEKEIGTVRFLMIFFAGGIVASVLAALYYPSSLGASGAIFAVMGALAVLRPGMTVWVSYIPMPMAVAVIVWAAIDLFGILMPSNVANAAHLGGLGAGLLYGLLLRMGRPLPQTRNTRHISGAEEHELDDYERRSGLR